MTPLLRLAAPLIEVYRADSRHSVHRTLVYAMLSGFLSRREAE